MNRKNSLAAISFSLGILLIPQIANCEAPRIHGIFPGVIESNAQPQVLSIQGKNFGITSLYAVLINGSFANASTVQRINANEIRLTVPPNPPTGSANVAIATLDNGEVKISNPVPVGIVQSYTRASQVTIRGVTWTFSQPEIVFTYTTGDYGVVAPPTGIQIVSISPAAQNITCAATGVTRVGNGSEVSPHADTQQQGFDGTVFYDDARNVGWPSRWATLRLYSGDRLVTSRSAPCQDWVNGSPLPWIRQKEVLTVVDQVPAQGTFRPPFVACSTPAAPFHRSLVNRTLLPNLPPLPNMDTSAAFLTNLTDEAKRPSDLYYSRHSANNNMIAYDNDYGYGAARLRKLGLFLLYLTLNSPIDQRNELLDGVIQRSLDAISDITCGDGEQFRPEAGGQRQGGNALLGLAPLFMLDLDLWMTVSAYLPQTTEWQTYFTVTPAMSGGPGGYTAQTVGLKEWRTHGTHPGNVSWSADSYRRCCTTLYQLNVIGPLRAISPTFLNLLFTPDQLGYTDRYWAVESAGQLSQGIYSALPFRYYDYVENNVRNTAVEPNWLTSFWLPNPAVPVP